MIANRVPTIPVHFASFANKTDEKGKFSRSGLSPGPIYVAVRRTKDEAWTVHGPASVSADVVIKIPAYSALTVHVKAASGAVPEDVEVKLCNTPGVNGPGVNLASVGMIPFLDVKKRLESSFTQFGLPSCILSDNGSPFASRGLGRLSRLGVWLLRLGVRPVLIQPGRPDQNGRHERFHETLKAETASPPRSTSTA